MKHRKMVARLAGRIKWYEGQSQSYKDSHKKPGSIKK
ncbi:hypothetical protein DAC23_154 [Bacteroides phage DAC23]|nr:hypothetical protein DAC23_154 [Bacteroides phage DAC23]